MINLPGLLADNTSVKHAPIIEGSPALPRKVLFEPIWKFHAFGYQLLAHPPEGYEFVVRRTSQEKTFDAISRWDFGRGLLRSVDLFLPTGLIKSWVERGNKAPDGVALTYACDHLILRPDPWVLEVEYASLVLGIDPKHLRRFKRTMERALASPSCRKIVCWAETGRRSLLHDMDASSFEHKIEVIHYAVPSRQFTKEYGTGKVRLLFVGSGTTKGGFEYRGGREVVAAFALLRQHYENIELVIRSDVPPDVRDRYSSVEGLRIIDEFIPRDELDHLFRSADVFLIPSHNTSPMITLDAMSYELPVVTLDTWANPEYVEDGKTGLVARSSTKLPYVYPGTAQPNWAAKEFVEAMRRPDPEVVQDLAAKIGRLIEDSELRRQMGKAARWEIEHGKSSLGHMNRRFAEVFDEAIAVAPEHVEKQRV